MFENVSLGQIMLAIILVGALLLLLLVFIASRIESLSKTTEKQQQMSELKSTITAEITNMKPPTSS